MSLVQVDGISIEFIGGFADDNGVPSPDLVGS